MSVPAPQAPPQATNQNEYIIWPRENMSPTDLSKTEAAIKSIIKSTEPLKNYTSKANGLRMWFAFLTIEQVAEVEKLEGVRGTEQDIEDPNQTDDAEDEDD